jgi:hypothetical protein
MMGMKTPINLVRVGWVGATALNPPLKRSDWSMKTSKVMLNVAGAGLLLAAVVSGGCAGYSSYPTVDGANLANKDPNGWPQYQLAGMAARYVAERYPPSAPTWTTGEPIQAPEHFVVNVPSGITQETYQRVIQFAGTGAEAPTATNASTPVYHVTRIWVRGGSGRVDVLRPIAEVGTGADGRTIFQTVTVFFDGGFKPWQITGRQVRDAVTADVPALALITNAPTKTRTASTQAQPEGGYSVHSPRPSQRLTLGASDSFASAINLQAQLAADTKRAQRDHYASVPGND